MIVGNSIDVVVFNCVLNFLGGTEKPHYFGSCIGFLKPEVRVVIFDILVDDDVPQVLQDDPE